MLRKEGVYDRLQVQDFRKIRKAQESFFQEELIIPTIDEIAERTGLKPIRIERLLRFHFITVSDMDYLPDERKSPADEYVENEFTMSMLNTYSKGFTPVVKRILNLLYLENKTMRETAEMLGYTEGRISQLHKIAIQELRRRWEENDPEFFEAMSNNSHRYLQTSH